jgi:hypothetical protein
MNRVVESGLVNLQRCIYTRLALFFCSSGIPVLRAQQRSSHHEQIGQRTGDEQSVGILGNAAVAHLDEAEEALDHQKRMLALGPQFRFVSILGPLHSAQRRVAAGLGLREVARVGATRRGSPRFARRRHCRPIRAYRRRAAGAPVPGLVHVGRRGHHGVDQLGFGSPPQCAPSCRSTTGWPSWFVSSRGHAHPIDSWSRTGR